MVYGIIGAQAVEIGLLLEKMREHKGSVTRTVAAGMEFCRGRIDGVEVVAVRSGVGKVNGALCCQELIRSFGAGAVINTGLAGAIGAGLKPMDLVLSTDLVYHDMDATGFGYEPTVIPQMLKSHFEADALLLVAAQKAATEQRLAFFSGRIATGDQFVASASAKAHIDRICRPLAVEMEGAAIAHTATLYKIPFLVIRCISDEADAAGVKTYAFNETAAANQSAELVIRLLRELK
jgi:adenosylhomocysteine nucleosidase